MSNIPSLSQDRMKQVGATLVAVEASKEAGGADLPGGRGWSDGGYLPNVDPGNLGNIEGVLDLFFGILMDIDDMSFYSGTLCLVVGIRWGWH